MGAAEELVSEINARLATAERLLASGVMVGDAAEQALWRGSRELWVTATTKGLTAAEVDENVIRTFVRAVTPPPGEGSLAEDLPVELEAIRNGMAILIGIRSRMTPASPAQAPAVDRRGRRLGP